MGPCLFCIRRLHRVWEDQSGNLCCLAKGPFWVWVCAQNPSVSITLFAFDKGEGVSTHTAPGDALPQVLDGDALVNIDGKEMTVGTGEVVVMPASIPHSINAVERFKMLLTVGKR